MLRKWYDNYKLENICRENHNHFVYKALSKIDVNVLNLTKNNF